MFIKNQTPYLGKIKLKFETDPWYGSSSNRLNKIHLNLRFRRWKLVSRIQIQKDLNGLVPDPEKVKLINEYTGGKIGRHTFGEHGEHVLENSFMAPDGTYIGDLAEGWRYYKNRMIVTQKEPKGVALLISKDFFHMDHRRDGLVEDYFSVFVEGYYGYSHRGGSTFKIGDRLFDPNYVPVESDYPKEEWYGYVKKAMQNIEEGNHLFSGDDYPISDVIPFKRRGKYQIKTWEEAEQAAINLSNYLS